MKTPLEGTYKRVENLGIELDKLGIELEKDTFRKIKSDLQNLINNQYNIDLMLDLLKSEIYPPHYIIDRVKMLHPADNNFDILITALRTACFRTSMMWKQSNMDVFDFLARHKK